MPEADAAQVCEDDRPLHREHAVEHADGARVFFRAHGGQPALPGGVVREGVDAMHLLGHGLILPRAAEGSGRG
ncbi:hypothetical protein HR12_20610 [Microbacterium sp. SUBG005]|nr:hypothetical protein HR12_20610 [Microbacterium sp. SUBG005]